MRIDVEKTELERILPLRAAFLAEGKRQVVRNAYHQRGWSDSYLLRIDGEDAGYGSTMAEERVGERNIVFEFYIVPRHRKAIRAAFAALLRKASAVRIECQSNDGLLAPMLFEFAEGIFSHVMLFEAGPPAGHDLPGAVVRPRRVEDQIFAHTSEPLGAFVLEQGGAIIATGGFLTHYNPPFADLYMEVEPSQRRRGAGRFLVQEVMKATVAEGLVPAARCNISNPGSRATLISAGMRPCGYMLAGTVR